MRGIFRVTGLLRDGFGFQFGDGATSFWSGSWCKEGPLSEKEGAWDWRNLYTLVPSELKNMVNEIQILGFGGLKDLWCWTYGDTGEYTTSSGYRWLSSQSGSYNTDISWTWLWKIDCQDKIRFLLWLMMHEAAPSNACYGLRVVWLTHLGVIVVLRLMRPIFTVFVTAPPEGICG
ncbi:hypothetical protein RIF29_10808 [Crotalaria pallida]|uniref:Reverse transcriptase zinc-binding domain-containing protein n=1 Tax=Crotalaria pallida TaxID=3830 RepID=A0AAN9IK18_CROPI